MNSENDNSEWRSCPAGVLASYAREQKSRQLGRWSIGIASSCLLITLCAYGLWSMNSPRNQYGKLGCDEVVPLTDSFLVGTLNDEFRVRIVRHLNHCKRCEEKYRQRADELNVDFRQAPTSAANMRLVYPLQLLAVRE